MPRLPHILLPFLLSIALSTLASPPVPSTQPDATIQTVTALTPNAELLKHLSITYYPSASQTYAYDAPGAGLPPVAQYDSYEVNGKTIQVPAKALADAGTDPVLVSVRKASTAPAGEVVFRYGNGDAVTISSRADTLWTLSLARPTAGDDEVWAWYLWRDSLDKPRESPLLKLNLGVYGGASQKLVVVPVNGASCPVTKEAIQNVLDDTYGQVAQKWTASIAAKLSVPEWDDNADGKFATNFDNNKPEISFTGDMKSVIKAMKAVGSYEEDTYYLFLIDAPQDRNPAFDGYMPVSSRFGFIFTRETSATTIAKTIAHELGHGAYNLMDYAPAGLRLHHAQWDNIEDPEWRPLANWGDESEGAGVIAGEEDLKMTLLTLGVNACAYCQRCDDPVKLEGVRFYFKDGKKYRCTFGVLKEDNTIESKDKEINQLIFKVDETQLSVFDQTILSEDRLKFVVLLKKLDASLKPQICDAYENYGNDYCSKAEPFLEKSFTDKVIADINKCKQPENGRILNYSSVTDIPNQEHLIELLSGNDTKNDPTGQRHTSKAWLVLTDATTSTENYTKAQNFDAPSGESKIWLHKTDKGWEIKSDLPQGVKDLENLTDGAGNKIYDMAKFAGEMALEGIDFIATGNYEIFDATAKGIRKLRIPNYAWDDTDPDYSKVYAYTYKFVLIGIAPVKELIKYGVSNGLALYLDNKEPEVSNILRKLGDGRIEFAFVCGVWNGAVETVASVPDLLKLIVTPMSSKGREEFSKFYATLKGFELTDETGKVIDSGVWCAIKTGFSEQFNTELKAAEGTGEIAFVVALCFVNPAAIESAGAKTLATIVKVLQRFDAIADKLNPASYALRFTTDLTAKLVNKSRNVVCGVVKEGTLTAKALTSKGKLTIVQNLDNLKLTNKGDEIIAEIDGVSHELLEDLPGYEIKTLADYGVYSKALPVSNGKYTERIFAIKAGDGASPANFFEEIEAKAVAQGATEIEIIGESVINKSFEKHADLFNTKWGYKFEKVTENGEEVIKLTKNLVYKNGWTKEKLLEIYKTCFDASGNKIADNKMPSPSEYLSEAFITNHLSKFSDGASYLVPKDIIDRFGDDILGWPDNAQFVMPKSSMDNLLSKTGNDIDKICGELGINPNDWKGRDIIRIDIPSTKDLNLRMPSGNEMGANKYWLPGGKLPTGYPEAVINNIPKGKYKPTPL